MTRYKGYSKAIFMFALLLAVAILPMVSAWSSNTFNNSLTSENLYYLNFASNDSFENDLNSWTVTGPLYSFASSGGSNPTALDGSYLLYSGNPGAPSNTNFTKTININGIMYIPIFINPTNNFRLLNITIYNNNNQIINISSINSYDASWHTYNITVNKGDNITIAFIRSNSGFSQYAWIDFIQYYSTDITRYLSIPNTVTTLTNGFMNLSGFISNKGMCFQEFANVSTACGGLATGSYFDYITCGGGSCSPWFDGNYATSVQGNEGGQTLGRVKYTKPLGATSTSLWQIKDGGGTFNLTIPQNCWDAYTSILQFLIFSNGGTDSTWYCWNSTDNIALRFSNNPAMFEEAIIWNITGTTSGETLTIGSSNMSIDLDANGTIPTTLRTSNLASVINSYLTASYLVGSNYLIPFIFHSDTAGILSYLDLNFSNEGFLENSQTYNSTTYETKQETFRINITYDSSYSIKANLTYNNTIYPATSLGGGNNIIFYKTLDIPSYSIGTNNFYWTIYLTNSSGTTSYQSTTNTQTVNPIILSLCNSTNNITYINFTFKDEATDTSMNSSIDLLTWNYYLGSGTVYKTLLFSNVTSNASYAFCFSPQDKTLNGNLLLQYSNTGYYQRQFGYTSQLTNSTLNQALYLLGTGSGSYSTIVTQSSAFTPVSGVLIQVERQFSGIWTLLTQQTTDASGSATFYLNPNYDHRFTATKTGYSSTTVTIRPTQSQYTIIMGSGQGNASYDSIMEGITYTVSPSSGFLNENTTYDFHFNISAALNNLDRYKIELVSVNGTILSSLEGTNSAGSDLNLSFNTGDYGTIYAIYSIDIGSGYYQIDPSVWSIKTITSNDGSIWKAIKNLISYRSNIEDNYGQLWWMFFLLFVGLASFSYFTGAELTSPGLILIPLFFLIIIFSYMGFFTIDFSPNAFMNKYGIAMVCLFLTGGFMLGRLNQ